MNYYEHHLGDWAAATGHLTWDEDMAYTRLLRAYYHSEKAIPEGQQYRLAKASTPAQRKAVDTVLDEFFVLTEGHYHQKRADQEIARYQDKQDKAKRSANARWNAQRSQSDGNADGMRTHSEGNALQTPDTIHQTPKEKKRASTRASPPDPIARPGDVPEQVWADWLALRARKKAPVTVTALEGAKAEASKAGLSLEAFLRVWCSRGSQGLEASWLTASERSAKPAETAYQRSMRERVDEITGGLLRPVKTGEIFDITEAVDATTRRLG